MGLPFKEYAFGGPPTVLAHAEYAVVSADRGRVEVSLRRVELDKTALLAQFDGCHLPLAIGLRGAYASPSPGTVAPRLSRGELSNGLGYGDYASMWTCAREQDERRRQLDAPVLHTPGSERRLPAISDLGSSGD